MSGKKVYDFLVPPRTEVADITGKIVGAGKVAKLHYKEYRRLTKNREVENGDQETTK